MAPTSATPMQNGYQFVNGVEMNAELGERFEIPNKWFKKYVTEGHFVELRVDSPRFGAHPGDASCACEYCKEDTTKPVLCHEEPATLIRVPREKHPSRGWGEQFWVRVTNRNGLMIEGVVDNLLVESRLHGLDEGSRVVFEEDHILAIHGIHFNEIVGSMSDPDLVLFLNWAEQRQADQS